MDLTSLSDEELLSGLSATMTSERQLVASVIAYLMEVEERRLDLKAACSSLFDFWTRRLGMSEGEAFRRITAARLCRRFPTLLARLERGEIHLSAMVILRDHLTDDNHEELVLAASGKTKRELQELLAARFPKPDVPATLRRLPTTHSSSLPSASSTQRASDHQAGRAIGPAPLAMGRIEPLGEATYKLQLTASRELRDKIERAALLMRHRNAKGDLAVVLEKALDVLIASLEKERLGKTTRPQKPREAKRGHVTRAARREVFERDGEQCTFVNDDGHRCPARDFLEIDHIQARALGGSGHASNLRIRCHAHNALFAEQTFGRRYVEERIHFRQHKPAAVNVALDREAPAEPFDLATKGLMNIGFREREARRAVSVVRGCVDATHASVPPVEQVLREALAVLC